MNFSLGGVKRVTLFAAATLFLTMGVAACSSDAKSPLDDTKKSTAAPDPAVADKAAVEKVVKDYWAALVKAQNTGDDDPAPLLAVADPSIVEGKITEVKQYQKLKLLRVGQPKITEVEVAVSGDTADIMLCKNEDGWTAEVDGDPVTGEKKFGNKPWGAQATRSGDTWKITDLRLPTEGTKTCA